MLGAQVAAVHSLNFSRAVFGWGKTGGKGYQVTYIVRAVAASPQFSAQESRAVPSPSSKESNSQADSFRC